MTLIHRKRSPFPKGKAETGMRGTHSLKGRQ